LLRYRKSLNISLVWHTNGYLRFFRCFGVKNRRKWNHSVVSSLYECTDLELKLQWLIRIVASNFIKISETVAEISYLTHLFKRQRPLAWIFWHFTFWTTIMLWITNMCNREKFYQNWSNVCKNIVKVWIFLWFGR